MLNTLLRLAATIAILLLPATAYAASGTALGVDPDARSETGKGGKTVRVLTVGADIDIGDRVVTDAKGLVQIRFSDKTELTVGPNSALLIEDYLLRNDGSAGKLAIDALAGTFRFTTGKAPKDRYLISTPTGTIGVRGTAFDFDVTAKATTVLLYHGAVNLCDLANQCVTISDACELGEADTSQSRLLGHTDDIKGDARDDLKAMFPYAVSDAKLLISFRDEAARRCVNRAPGEAPADIDSTVSKHIPLRQRFF